MSDYRTVESAATAKDARDLAGRPRGARAADVDAALMRYLAAEEYHEKVEEIREDATGSASGTHR